MDLGKNNFTDSNGDSPVFVGRKLGPSPSARQKILFLTPAVWERIGWCLFVTLLLLGLLISFHRAVNYRSGTPSSQCPTSDFVDFHEASRYLWEHGVRNPNTGFGKYLPSLDVACMPLAWLPRPLAAVVWYLLGAWSWIGLLSTIRRYLLPEVDPTTARRAVLTAGLLAMPLAIDGVCLGAFHIFMVWLMVAGLGRISRNRPWSGAALLGTAIWLKLLPVVGVAYLLLKRRSAAGAGRPGICPAHRRGSFRRRSGAAGRLGGTCPLVSSARRWRGQPAVEHIRQYRRGPPDQPVDGGDLAAAVHKLQSCFPRQPSCPPERQQVVLMKLSARQLTAVYAVCLGLLGLATAFYCRRSARTTSAPRWGSEIALVALSTLWFSPVVWSYHPTAAVPALAVIMSQGPQRRCLTWLVAIVWLAALILLASAVARLCGVLFWVNLCDGRHAGVGYKGGIRD